MKKFIKEVKAIGEKESYFNEGIVGTFNDAIKENFSICNFYGIDGDKLKNEKYSEFFEDVPKSCDVIKFLENSIDFIEFKTLYIAENANINKRINQYELTEKLKGSYELIKAIVNKLKLTFSDKNNAIILVSKKFRVSFHLHGYDSRNKLLFYQKIGIIERNMRGYFLNNPLPFGEGFDEPEFILTENINSKY